MFKKTNFYKNFLMITMILLVPGSLMLSGCDTGNNAEPTDDAGMVFTNVAETLSAMTTQTFAAEPTATLEPSPTESPTGTVTPTITLLPTTVSSGSNYASATPSSNCDQAGFVSDVTIPDGTEIDPGVEFTKTWKLSNDGTCTWNSSYTLVFYSGSQMSGPDSQEILDDDTYLYPGSSIEISVDLTAPTEAGTYTGYWVLKNASGGSFAIGTSGNPFYVQIEVDTSSTATPTPSVTSTISSETTATPSLTPTQTLTTVVDTTTPTIVVDTSTPTMTTVPSSTPTETTVPTEDSGGGTGDGG